MNIYEKYQKALSKEQKVALSFFTALADELSIKACLVGGIVRDMLLSRPFQDIDVVLETDAIIFCDILQSKYFENIEILAKNEKFKTVKLEFIFNEKTFQVDVASTRSEIYEYPSCLPILAETVVPLKKDLMRRDFSVNALAVSLNSMDFCRVVDETGGLNDIENSKIKILHNDSFLDDPSRIIRGLRYRALLGFSLDEKTKLLQDNCLKNKKYIALCQDRVKKELKKTLNIISAEIFDKFVSENIYKLIVPKISKLNLPSGNLIMQIISSNLKHINSDFLWIIILCIIFNFMPCEYIDETIEKLALTRYEKQIFFDFFDLKEKLFEFEIKNTNFEIYEFLNKYSLESLVAWQCLPMNCNNNSKITKYLNELRFVKLTVSGSDIEGFGIRNGKLYGKILKDVLRAKLDGRVEECSEKRFLELICNDYKPEK